MAWNICLFAQNITDQPKFLRLLDFLVSSDSCMIVFFISAVILTEFKNYDFDEMDFMKMMEVKKCEFNLLKINKILKKATEIYEKFSKDPNMIMQYNRMLHKESSLKMDEPKLENLEPNSSLIFIGTTIVSFLAHKLINFALKNKS